MEWLSMKMWSPYVVGAGIGMLSWFTFLLSDTYIGCSTAFARASGMIERLLRGSKVDNKPYYTKFPLIVDWEWMLVIGVVIGAYISAKLSGEFQVQWVPERWEASFGSAISARWLVALIGGTIIGFGSRWAGGCTSGHGISGSLQLAVSSWVAAICFFIGGIVTAMVIFRLFTG